MDKGALNIKLFDFTLQKDIFLIFCKDAPACSLNTFLAYCYQFSPEYINTLRTYKQGDSYDLRFIVNYFTRCFATLFNHSDIAKKYFDKNFMFYMRNATNIFTAIKIYAALLSEPATSSSAKQSDKIPRRRSSEKDLLALQTVAQSTSHVDTTLTAHTDSTFWRKRSRNNQEKTYQTDKLQAPESGETICGNIKVPT